MTTSTDAIEGTGRTLRTLTDRLGVRHCVSRQGAVTMLVQSGAADRASMLAELVRICAKATHRHVLPVVDVATAADGVAIARPLPAYELSTWLVAGSPAPGEAVTVLAPLLGALDTLHMAGVTVGGLSAAAVWIDEHGAPMLDPLGAGASPKGEERAAFDARRQDDLRGFLALAENVLAHCGASVQPALEEAILRGRYSTAAALLLRQWSALPISPPPDARAATGAEAGLRYVRAAVEAPERAEPRGRLARTTHRASALVASGASAIRALRWRARILGGAGLLALAGTCWMLAATATVGETPPQSELAESATPSPDAETPGEDAETPSAGDGATDPASTGVKAAPSPSMTDAAHDSAGEAAMQTSAAEVPAIASALASAEFDVLQRAVPEIDHASLEDAEFRAASEMGDVVVVAAELDGAGALAIVLMRTDGEWHIRDAWRYDEAGAE